METETLINEQVFIAALKSGDRSAFAKMVDRFSNQIYNLALKVTEDPRDAEDVLQETFIKAMRALPGFEGRSSLSTWLHRIAINEALMMLRKRKPELVLMEENTEDEDEPRPGNLIFADWCCLPENEFLSDESRQYLDQAVQQLPTTLRTVFLLRDVQGLSIRETAEALNLTQTNVKTRLLRARLHLRESLSRYFGDRTAEKKSDG